MGVDFKRRWPTTREYIRAIKELWTKPEASFSGEFVNFPPVRCNPKPARKPHPPIHIGATASGAGRERALRDTVAIADGWGPLALPAATLAAELSRLRQMCDEAGRNFADLEITMYSPVVEGDTKGTREAYRKAGAHRLVLIIDNPRRESYERQLGDLAQAWIG